MYLNPDSPNTEHIVPFTCEKIIVLQTREVTDLVKFRE
jgi:hypothetical protein